MCDKVMSKSQMIWRIAELSEENEQLNKKIANLEYTLYKIRTALEIKFRGNVLIEKIISEIDEEVGVNHLKDSEAIEIIRKIAEQNKEIDAALKQLNRLKEFAAKNIGIRCTHLVLDECSINGENCIGVCECLNKHQAAIKDVVEFCESKIKYRMTSGDSRPTKESRIYENIIRKIDEIMKGK